MDQVKRASAYRKWVAALYFVLLHNSHAREILDPITFEVNMYVSLPLDVLEGTSLFISSKLGERLLSQTCRNSGESISAIVTATVRNS